MVNKKEIVINMKGMMSKYNNQLMMKLIIDLIDAQDASNFASFRFNIDGKKGEYYMIAGKATGDSIQEKYGEAIDLLRNIVDETGNRDGAMFLESLQEKS